MTRTWVRPYRVGKGRWVVAAWELAALAFLYPTTLDLFGLDDRARAALVAGLALVWAWVCWRLVRLGLYVGPAGLRVHGLLTVRTVAWADVDRLVVDTVSHRLGPVRVPAGRTVWIETIAGDRIGSTLWADGVDFRFRPALFTGVYAELRRRHAAVRADVSTAGTTR